MNDVVLLADEITLAEHAAVIRALGKRVVGDIVEIGRRLSACKAHLNHGGWLPWLDREFGWSERMAQNFMQVADLATKSAKFADISIPVSGLYLLAAPSTPTEVQDEVIARAEAGETFTLIELKQMVAEAKVSVEETAQDRLRAERQHYETRLAKARQDADDRVAALQQEYEGKLIFDPDTIEQVLKEHTAPLEKKIARYEQKLADLAKREEDRRARKQTDKPPIDNAAHAASTTVVSALAYMASRLSISPAELIAVERRLLSATGETLEQRLGAAVRNATTVRSWLVGFCEQASAALKEGEGDGSGSP